MEDENNQSIDIDYFFNNTNDFDYEPIDYGNDLSNFNKEPLDYFGNDSIYFNKDLIDFLGNDSNNFENKKISIGNDNGGALFNDENLGEKHITNNSSVENRYFRVCYCRSKGCNIQPMSFSEFKKILFMTIKDKTLKINITKNMLKGIYENIKEYCLLNNICPDRIWPKLRRTEMRKKESVLETMYKNADLILKYLQFYFQKSLNAQ